MWNATTGKVSSCCNLDIAPIIDLCNEFSLLQHLRTLVGHTGGVWCSEFNGTTVVSGSTDRTLRVSHHFCGCSCMYMYVCWLYVQVCLLEVNDYVFVVYNVSDVAITCEEHLTEPMQRK